jgi:hypothetical protein
VECTNSRCPKRRKDLRRRSEKDLTVGFHLEWAWTHGCVPCASESRQVRGVGPDDATEGDVDPPERTMCHSCEGRQLCCGPGE